MNAKGFNVGFLASLVFNPVNLGGAKMFVIAKDKSIESLVLAVFKPIKRRY